MVIFLFGMMMHWQWWRSSPASSLTKLSPPEKLSSAFGFNPWIWLLVLVLGLFVFTSSCWLTLCTLPTFSDQTLAQRPYLEWEVDFFAAKPTWCYWPIVDCWFSWQSQPGVIDPLLIVDFHGKTNLVLLTLATTSFSESNWVMQATGPKISSCFGKMITVMLMLAKRMMNLHASRAVRQTRDQGWLDKKTIPGNQVDNEDFEDY